jgi:hypothetical protein
VWNDGTAGAFVENVVRTGVVLTDLLSNLLDELPDDAFPGEEPGEVLLEMLVGSVRPVVDAAGESTVHECGALLAALVDKALADLRAAAQLAAER